jgi:hypothetical protein
VKPLVIGSGVQGLVLQYGRGDGIERGVPLERGVR